MTEDARTMLGKTVDPASTALIVIDV